MRCLQAAPQKPSAESIVSKVAPAKPQMEALDKVRCASAGSPLLCLSPALMLGSSPAAQLCCGADSLHAHVCKVHNTPGCCTSFADFKAVSARRHEAATYLEALPRAQKAPPAAALEQPAERPRPSAAPAAKPAGVAQPVEAGRPGKRRGPLPLWLVELVVIAAVPGLLYALLRWEAQARGPPRGPRPQPGLVTLPYSTGHGSHHWSP